MTFQPTSTLKKLLALLAAAVASTMLVAVGPASAAIGVTVSNAGDLVITGTADRDHVLILADGDTIDVELRSGSSQVNSTFTRQDLRRDLIINLGAGGGYIGVIELDVPRDLKITTGPGVNQIVYEGVHVGRNTKVVDGDGEIDVSLSQTTVLGRSDFSMGTGHNYFEFHQNYFAGNFTYRVAPTGRMAGSISSSIHLKPFRLTGGNGDDFLSIRGDDSEFGTTTIDLRGGTDNLRIRDAMRFGRAVIRGGSGNDLIDVQQAVMETTYTIDMGSGDDITTMQSVRSQGRAIINGGAGRGDLLGVVSSSGTPLQVRDVEGGYGY